MNYFLKNSFDFSITNLYLPIRLGVVWRGDAVGICLMASVKGIVMVTFLKASSRLSSVSLVLAFGRFRA